MKGVAFTAALWHRLFMTNTNKTPSQIKAEMNDLGALLRRDDLGQEREDAVWELYFKLEDALKRAC